MVVTTALIPLVSPFAVGPTGDFTQLAFDQYKIWAEAELKRLDPGVDGETFDYCHALLICHIFDISPQSKKGEFKSEKIGDYSYTKADLNESGSSTYYKRVQQLIKQWATEQATAGVEREDANTTFPKKMFKLDQREKVRFI
jgi:hypothetical protein